MILLFVVRSKQIPVSLRVMLQEQTLQHSTVPGPMLRTLAILTTLPMYIFAAWLLRRGATGLHRRSSYWSRTISAFDMKLLSDYEVETAKRDANLTGHAKVK
jgi:branched-subunit amino acid ABC-type transport system permease component